MARHFRWTIAERSRLQLGLITRTQILDLGFSERQLHLAVRRGDLEPVEPWVYRVAGAPISWEQQLMAGQLGLGPLSLISHLAAGALWSLDGIRPGRIDFLVPRGHRNRCAVGQVHSSLSIEDEDVNTRRGFRVTSPTRTIIDAEPWMTMRMLEGVVDGACRDRLTTEELLLDRLQRLRRPKRSRLVAVLAADAPTGRPHTWLERELLRVLRRARAPLPRVQTVLTAEGKVSRVDAYYDDARVVVEVAGHRTHSTRRARQADYERRLRLEAAGHAVAEFSYEDVTERPDYVVRSILAKLSVTPDDAARRAG